MLSIKGYGLPDRSNNRLSALRTYSPRPDWPGDLVG
jgi:hypothetical protein